MGRALGPGDSGLPAAGGQEGQQRPQETLKSGVDTRGGLVVTDTAAAQVSGEGAVTQ